MSVAEEKEKPPESASNSSVTDVSRFPIVDEDSEGKYEMSGGGGTVYRVVLLGNMFESFYALFGLIAVVTGMFATWAITNYAVSSNRLGSDEDEFGTDIDNPEKSPSKDKPRRRSSNDSPGDTENVTAAENSTSLPTRNEHPNQPARARRRLGSESESTHSSIDDFADAMDTVQHSKDYPDSGRPRDDDDDDDDNFVNLDNDGREVMEGNREANFLHSVEDGSISDDLLVKSESESGSEIGIDEALDDAYAMLDMQNDDASSKNNVNTETTSNSHPTPVDEDVKLSLTSSEESTPEFSSLLENNDRQETLDESEEGSSVDKEISTLQTSTEYVLIETHDVPNAPVVKNAIDDDVIEDGSDDTTTSSDADTVKDAGGDINGREHDLDRDERTEIENVVASLIADEMVNEARGDMDGIEPLDHDKRNEVGNIVADTISYLMIRDAEEDLSETEHDEPREERTDAVNVVADLISNDMVNETSRDRDITHQACNDVDDLVQPVDSHEVECWLRNNPKSDETNYSKKQSNVKNVVAESLANEMVLEMLDELAIRSSPILADNDSELPQTVVSQNTDDRNYRRVSDAPIPQIRIDSFDDDGVVVEVSVVEDEFASPQRELVIDNEDTSALSDVAYDHTVPHNDDEIAIDAYQTEDLIPQNDENQNQTKPETKHSIESTTDALIVATVKTPHEDPTDVKHLLTNLTGEDIPPRDADDEGETNFNPKVGMAEFMVTIGSKNYEDHGHVDDDNAAVDNNQRQTIDEEIITSAMARPVECSNINAFCSRPQEPKDSGISVHQDLKTEESIYTDPDSEDQVVIVEVTVPKANLRDVLSSLGGEGSYEAEEGEDVEEESGDLRIEDFLLPEVKGQHFIDSEDSNKHFYNGEPIHEDSVMPAPMSVDDSKDVDYFSNIHGNDDDDQEQKSPSRDEVVVPRPIAAGEAELDLDVSSILSNVPFAPPSNITPRKVFDDDVVATDVRKATNGRVNLKSLLKSLGGDLSVDVDLNDSDVSEPSPQRKKVITDEMVREAIQYLLQQPFMHSYGMYDSQDTLFYDAIFDDSLYTGGRTFALVSNLHGKGLTPEKKSTVFALVSSPSKENLADDDDDPSDVDEPIFPDQQDEEECEINLNELFANLDRRSKEDQDTISPKQGVNEGYIEDNTGAVEEALRELSTERDVGGFPEVQGYPAEVQSYPAQVRGYPAEDHGYPAEAHGYPAEVQGSPAEAWGHPAEVRGYPAEVQGYPAEAHGYPAEVQGYPAEAWGHPAEVRGYPAEVQGHPAEVRGYPAEVQGYLPEVEDHPAEAHAYPGEVQSYLPEVRGHPAEVQRYPLEAQGYRADFQGYAEVDDAVPVEWGPDSISYSDDDSSSVSSSDTSGTYILDNQMGLVEEDEEDEQPRFKQPSFPRDMPHDTTNVSSDIPSYHGYDNIPFNVQEEQEEEEEEEPEPPQTSRMFFITSAMLAQMSQEQNDESSSDDDYERRGRQSDSPGSSSGDDYLEPIPAGYGPDSARVWPQNTASTAYHQYLPEEEPTRSYGKEVPTAEYDYDDETKFRPISGGESSVEPTPRYPTSNAPKDNPVVTHPSQNGHGLSDYDSSPELLEIEKQRQKLFLPSPHDYDPPPQKSEQLQNGDDMDYLPERLLPAVEPTVTMNMKYPDETAPTRVKDMFENVPSDFKPIPEPTITRDMNVPEQLQPVFTRPVFHQGLPEDDPRTNPSAHSYESLDNFTRDPSHVEPNMVSNEYARTNGHHEPLSQSEDSMWSHSDYRGYSGSSEDGEFDVNDDTSFASGERMFALVGLRSADSTPVALSVNASIEVYRAEEHMETQMSLYSYEISKGIAGPDGKMVKLQEQSFSFERRSDSSVKFTDSREAVISESVSDSVEEHFSHPGQDNNHSEEAHDHLFAPAERHSDNVEDSIDSPGDVNETEGVSMNDTITADFTGEQFAYQPEQQANDYHSEDLKLDLPFDSAGEEMSEREGLQRQVESLSELLSERTLDMQRFKDDYPFLDRIMANPKEGVAGYEEGQLIGLIETYRQLEDDVLELMNIYKETKTQLAELDRMERS